MLMDSNNGNGARYLVFPGPLPAPLVAATFEEAQDKARSLARSGHELARIFEPVWIVTRSDDLTEGFLVSGANVHGIGPDTNPVPNDATPSIPATDVAHVPDAVCSQCGAPFTLCSCTASQADGTSAAPMREATEAQPDPSRIPLNPGV